MIHIDLMDVNDLLLLLRNCTLFTSLCLPLFYASVVVIPFVLCLAKFCVSLRPIFYCNTHHLIMFCKYCFHILLRGDTDTVSPWPKQSPKLLAQFGNNDVRRLTRICLCMQLSFYLPFQGCAAIVWQINQRVMYL